MTQCTSCEIKKLDRSEHLVMPIMQLKNCTIPSPRSVILDIISRCRESSVTDKEITDAITTTIHFLLKDNKLRIVPGTNSNWLLFEDEDK